MSEYEEPTLFDSMVKPKLSPAYPDRAPWGTSVSLRAWQAEAMKKYFETNPRDFMAVATPGAGKTTFALTLARELFDRGVVRKLTVVAPTERNSGRMPPLRSVFRSIPISKTPMFTLDASTRA